MSSLRLAMKLSMEESGGPEVSSKRKKKKPRNRDDRRDRNRKSRRQPGDPPRKRGRPRKHPLPEEEEEERPHNHDEEEESRASSSENEFDSAQESEDDASEDEKETAPNTARGGDSSSDSDKSEEHRKVQKKTMKKRHKAAHTIQHQWKKKSASTGDKDEKGGTPQVAQAKKDDGDAESTKKKKQKQSQGNNNNNKAQTVPPPAPERVAWMREISLKTQRRSIQKGLRVKVRFASRVRKRSGKVVRRIKWYGGLVTAVSTGGSKIRIKYDDGTSEVSKFPEKDVIVDDEGNGRHRESAGAFDMPEEEEEEGSMEVPKGDGAESEDSDEKASNEARRIESLVERKDNSVSTKEEMSALVDTPEASKPEFVVANVKSAPKLAVDVDTGEASKESVTSPRVKKRKRGRPPKNPQAVPLEIRRLLEDEKKELENIGGRSSPFLGMRNAPKKPEATERTASEEPVEPPVPPKPTLKIRLVVPPKKEIKDTEMETEVPADGEESEEEMSDNDGDGSIEEGGAVETIEEPAVPRGLEAEESAVGKKRPMEPHAEISDEPPAKRLDSRKPALEESEQSKPECEGPKQAPAESEHLPQEPSMTSVDKTASATADNENKEDAKMARASPVEKPSDTEDEKVAPALSSETATRKEGDIFSPKSHSSDTALGNSAVRSPTTLESPKGLPESAEEGQLLKPVSTQADSNLADGSHTDEPVKEKPALESSTHSAFERKDKSDSKKEYSQEPSAPPAQEAPKESAASDGETSRASAVLTPVPSSFADEPYSPVPRSGRRAAQQANERIAARQEIVIQDPYAKAKKKRDKTELKLSYPVESSKRKRKSENSDDDDGREWVCCDKCSKWRILPSGVETDKLPKHWYCEMNIHDTLRNSCDAPEQTPQEIRKERKRAKKKAAKLARRQAAEQAAGNDEARASSQKAELKKIKKERDKDRRSPANDRKLGQSDKEGVEDSRQESPGGPGRSRSQSPRSDGELESRKNPSIKKQSSFGSSGRRSRMDDEVEGAAADSEIISESVPKKRGRKPSRNKEGAVKDADKGKKGKGSAQVTEENQEWVMCEKCSKWRRLPPHVSADSLPDVWYCTMNTWNVANATCDAPEDKAEPGTREFGGIYGSGVNTSASGNKLSYRNLIFGTAGRKQNRPVSERTRAAESLFAVPEETPEGGGHPKVMYANSSVFVPRGSKSAADTNRMSFFDLMAHSSLWAELRSSSIMRNTAAKAMPIVYKSSGKTDFEFHSFSPEIKGIIKEIVYHALGTNCLEGHEVLLEAQCRQWEGVPATWSEVRPFCNVHNVVNALLELAQEGRVEVIQTQADLPPSYRRVVAKPVSPRNSKCMKIAKPWKQGLSIS